MGFGFKVVAVPLLAFVVAPRDAVTIGFLLGVIPSRVSALLAARRGHVRRKLLLLLFLGTLPGLALGTVTIAVVNQGVLQVLIGIADAAMPILFLLTRLSSVAALFALVRALALE